MAHLKQVQGIKDFKELFHNLGMIVQQNHLLASKIQIKIIWVKGIKFIKVQ